MRRRRSALPPLAQLEAALFELAQLVDLAWQLAPPESGYAPPWLMFVSSPVQRAQAAFDALCLERKKGVPVYTSCAVEPKAEGGTSL